MMDSKPWYTSKTIWAGIITVGAGAVAAFTNKHLSPEDANTLADNAVQIASAVAALVPVITGIVTIFGRLKADKPISGTKAAE